MEQIPTDRGFLDLTRLEPGVQLLDGQVLAPSKSGLTATSVVGRNGRTTRMQVDGLDVTDEAVGATTTNIPVGAIQEVEVEQSLLPLSSGLASAGAGERDHEVRRERSSRPALWQLSQQGCWRRQPSRRSGQFLLARSFWRNVGGAWKKDKLFYFLSGEYFKQDLDAPVVFNAPFDVLDGSYKAPFHETEGSGRLDYKLLRPVAIVLPFHL